MDSRIDTYEHIREVQGNLHRCIEQLIYRAHVHDRSKLSSPEREIFDEFTPLLSASTYGSEEYKTFLAGMKPGLDHHYAHNRHHPEFFGCDVCVQCGAKGPDACTCGGPKRASLSGMNILDLLEMFCDWLAATKRHANGDIRRSIDFNQTRFGYTDELKEILHNTANMIGREVWHCFGCGAGGHTGNFCDQCGAGKDDYKAKQ